MLHRTINQICDIIKIDSFQVKNELFKNGLILNSLDKRKNGKFSKHSTDFFVENFKYFLIEKNEMKKIINNIISKENKKNWEEANDEEFYFGFKKENYYHIEKSIEQINAEIKNKKLIKELEKIRYEALGIGTRKIKIRLNKISKENNIANALRIAMEIEDVNIQAKKSSYPYKEKIYNQKANLIKNLIKLFLKNNWNFGKENNSTPKTNHIVYFEIPGCEQISFHTNLIETNIPDYSGEWDKKENSTYPKILNAVKKLFPEILI